MAAGVINPKTKMNEFDIKAKEWDSNPMHNERSEAIAKSIINKGIIKPGMRGLEFGAGTGILSFLLSDTLREIILVDNSAGMIKIAAEKITEKKKNNLIPMLANLEQESYTGPAPDFIFSQMALHHITDTNSLFRKFYSMLNEKGYMAIADIYTEDGSFHGEGFTGHNGFDVAQLAKDAEECGFINISSSECYVIKKQVGNSIREYPVFLLLAQK